MGSDIPVQCGPSKSGAPYRLPPHYEQNDRQSDLTENINFPQLSWCSTTRFKNGLSIKIDQVSIVKVKFGRG